MAKVRILIVEDEMLIAQELRSQLEHQGYEVAALAKDGVEARRALEMYRLDLILLDIKLKGPEDGISVAHHINKTYQLPIIFISSLTDKSTIAQAKEARPSAYLVKPYNPAELFIAIDMALHRSEMGTFAKDIINKPSDKSSHYLLNEHIFIKDKYRFERVEFQEILWLKAEGSYVMVKTPDKIYLLTTDTLKSFLEKIQAPHLFRVHRSFAVNIHRIDALEGNRLFIGPEEIPIGKNYHSAIQGQLRLL